MGSQKVESLFLCCVFYSAEQSFGIIFHWEWYLVGYTLVEDGPTDVISR